MPVTCPKCDARIPAADVELSTRLAKCRRCDEVFALDLPGGSRPDNLAMLPIPDGVRVDDDGYTRRLSYRWFTPVVFFLAFFCVAWDSFLVFWYTMALAGPVKGAGGFQWLMVVFPVAHVAVGVGLTYYTVCVFLNRTTVSVGDRLKVEHLPLFWPGQVSLPADAVRAVYCEQSSTTRKGTTRFHYTLKAVKDDGRAITLLANLDSLPRARFFERKIEEWLNLPPTPVPGEAS
ncbi:MAG: zinc-ribbon domain-containing protein [Fimbriiglobus sp.]|jgi:hypothetical protein|nr:zinc-ribbon domain-containing protein [Fimbriiglobus sp.]